MGIMKVIGRIIVTLIGFTLAALTAVAVLFLLGAMWVADVTVTAADDDIDRIFNGLTQAYGTVLFIATVAPTLTILPGIIAAVAGEIGNIRSLLYYVVAGGVAMAALPIMSATVATEAGLPSATFMAIFATAGFAAGLMYWLVAGRTA